MSCPLKVTSKSRPQGSILSSLKSKEISVNVFRDFQTPCWCRKRCLDFAIINLFFLF
eukprot:UN03070